MADGIVIYRGKSRLDGKPIVAVLTGLAGGSSNTKTGGMLQTHIMRADVEPHIAVKTGQDVSVCGDCPMRGQACGDSNKGRACYVRVYQAPLSIYRAFKRGRYPTASVAGLRAVGAGRRIRLGSYGDPVAVPIDVWRALTVSASGWTGYTHQWRNPVARGFKPLCLASVETADGLALASRWGWRSFYVASPDAIAVPGLTLCPASDLAGKRVQCEACGLCAGTTRAARSIWIPGHGGGKRALIQIAAA